jgi:hypothetical protein
LVPVPSTCGDVNVVDDDPVKTSENWRQRPSSVKCWSVFW